MSSEDLNTNLEKQKKKKKPFNFILLGYGNLFLAIIGRYFGYTFGLAMILSLSSLVSAIVLMRSDEKPKKNHGVFILVLWLITSLFGWNPPGIFLGEYYTIVFKQ